MERDAEKFLDALASGAPTPGGGGAAALAEAAAKSAALNVFINTRAMSGREAADRLNIEANSLMTHCCLVAGEIYDEGYGRLADG